MSIEETVFNEEDENGSDTKIFHADDKILTTSGDCLCQKRDFYQFRWEFLVIHRRAAEGMDAS